MKLYDECFDGIKKLLSDYEVRELDITEKGWQDAGGNQLVFQNDTAFELGGGDLPAVSTMALTDNTELVPCDKVLLCGRDLDKIGSDTPFARIALLRVKENSLGDGNALYQSIRKIEYTRYHVNPKGYMIRISPFSHRESARVSKQAVSDGISFAAVGKLFIDSYHKHSGVEAAEIIFITAPDFPYGELKKVMQRSEDITKALDHLMKNIKMDCQVCSLKAVCEEVEELCNETKNNKSEVKV